MTTSALALDDLAVENYLRAQESKDLLRFITCGSVDDGKSTLIGRLLFDSKHLFEDQLASLDAESQRFGTQGDKLDLALLVDGLQAEREQGITIDVAYRFFATDQRKFVVADTPGHEQYTRNMATGASTAELAVILADARKGIVTQTRRHSYIVSLLGIRHVVLAVNKMDLVDYGERVFEAIRREFVKFAANLGIPHVECIPVSALEGENVLRRSERMPWYDGPSLMELLETVEVARNQNALPMRFPVQYANRPDASFRGFSGSLASGVVRPGDRIAVFPSGAKSRVKRIVTADGDLEEAVAGDAITLELEDDIDVSRGDLIAPVGAEPEHSDQFAAHIIWMDAEPMLPERPYLLRIGTRHVTAQVTDLRYKIDVTTLEHLASKTLRMNEIGYCNLAIDRIVGFDPYRENRQTGSFILIDKFTNATVGAGLVEFGLRRASNIGWHHMEVTKTTRAKSKGQRPCLLWFTGLSGAGKSTIADRLEQRLHASGHHTYLLDGDNVRHGLNKDLGFTNEDRVENIRRIAEVAKLMLDAGLIVLVSFISPFRSERRMARELVEDGEFIEIFVDTPLEVCEKRDPKGLYKKARAGRIKNFTGIDSDYERPESPEITLRTEAADIERLVGAVLDYLRDGRYL
jgi:bifunctional enzyme CysN/CysC